MGRLFLIVGPSGAGKDTVLNLARDLLADQAIIFARRVITRASQDGNEAHEAVNEAEFQARASRGAFALQWAAHGLHYGIPADELAPLAAGQRVVASVSRTIIAETAARFPVQVVEITASSDLRRQRLAGRARESTDAIAERLGRDLALPANVPVTTLINDAAPEIAAQALIRVLCG